MVYFIIHFKSPDTLIYATSSYTCYNCFNIFLLFQKFENFFKRNFLGKISLKFISEIQKFDFLQIQL